MATLMLSDALRALAGPLAEFHRNLCGKDGTTVWLPAFKRFLRKENPWDGKPFFPVWKTVTVGSYASAAELIEAVESTGMFVSEEIKALERAGKISIAKEPQEVDLIRPTLDELKLIDSLYSGFYRHLPNVGLRPCTLEMLLLARMAYTNQPADSSLRAIMKLIEIDGKKYSVDLDNLWTPSIENAIVMYEDGNDSWSEWVEFICALPYD